MTETTPKEEAVAPEPGLPTLPPSEVKAFAAIQSHWKDGLPKDSAEDAVTETTLYAGGLTSRYSSLKRLHDGSDQAAREEEKRIEEEEKVKAEQQMEQMTQTAAIEAQEFKQSTQQVANMRKTESTQQQGG